jgi:hypothetical protein
MQKKFPYSVLKWTLMLGVASSMATACVVTSGDGSGLGDGGEGNENTGNVGNAAGEPNSNGGTTSAGTSSGGSATAGSSTAGTTAAGGEGGGAAAYVPGQCMDQSPTPSSEPSCDTSTGNQAECSKCLKTKACTLYKECYGTGPTSACGYGPVEGDGGQFQCILDCFNKNEDNIALADDLFASCGAGCALQCDVDGAIMDVTNDLADLAYKDCNAECFPFE